MRITSSIEYATRLMVTLAREHGRGAMTADRLAAADNIPADYVAQLLVKLRRAGLVEGRRGATGGYTLSRPPADVTLGQVARAVEGRIFEDVCGKYEKGDKDCRQQSGCGISPVWKRLGALITEFFDGITLAALLEEKPGACGTVLALEKLGRER